MDIKITSTRNIKYLDYILERINEVNVFGKTTLKDNVLKTYTNDSTDCRYIIEAIINVSSDIYFQRDIYKFMNETYFFLKNSEINEIIEESKKYFKGEKDNIISNNMEKVMYANNKKKQIISSLMDIFDNSEILNLDGILMFRNKEIKTYIETILDVIVEIYMVDKEYTEFIKLLKYFVEIQDSQMDFIKITSLDKGYKIEDENGKDVYDDLSEQLSDTKFTNSVNEEDIIISGLITKAPNKIVVECTEEEMEKEFIKTLQNVFESRISFITKNN